MEIEKQGNDYLVTAEHIVFRFSHLHEHSEGYSSYLEILTVGLAGAPDDIYYEGQVGNILGSRTKSEIAKHVGERFPDADWALLVTRAVRLVRSAAQTGSPVKAIEEVLQPEPTTYWLEPILQDKSPTLLFGAGGTGKSTLSRMFTVLIAAGQKIEGFSPRQGRILTLDYEDDEDTWKTDIEAIASGLSLPSPKGIFYKTGDAPLVSLRDSLARQIATKQIDGLIVDSAAMACIDDPEKTAAAVSYFQALRSLPLRWSLTIAHQPKDKERSNDPFGSTFWLNSPRSVWRVRQGAEEGEDTIHVGLWHRKANHQRRSLPIGFQITHTDSQILIKREDTRNVSEFREHMGAKAKIIAYLSEARKPVSRKEIQEEVNLKPDEIRGRLSELKRQGKITERDGRIGLVYEEFE